MKNVYRTQMNKYILNLYLVFYVKMFAYFTQTFNHVETFSAACLTDRFVCGLTLPKHLRSYHDGAYL